MSQVQKWSGPDEIGKPAGDGGERAINRYVILRSSDILPFQKAPSGFPPPMFVLSNTYLEHRLGQSNGITMLAAASQSAFFCLV